MNFKDVLEKAKKTVRWVTFYLGVPKCVECEEPLYTPFMPICPECFEKYKRIKTANCSQCARLLHECSCVNEYLEAHFIKQHFKVLRYESREENSVANELIFSLKMDNRADVREFIASEMAATLANFVGDRRDIIFTNVPRRRDAIINYGMDHAADLARILAKHFNSEYRSILFSESTKPQKRTRGAERESNLEFGIREKYPAPLTDKTVIIVDDIVTTGASVATAGALIRSLGAKNIVAASFAATYKDKPQALYEAELARREERWL